MAQFSAKKTYDLSFSAYYKHFVLLVMATIIVAAPLWFCSGILERIARQSGIPEAVNIIAIAKKQGHPAGFASVGSEMAANLKTIPAQYYLAWLLVFLCGYALFFFLTFGLMNICLTLKDTGHGSLKLLFSSSFDQVKHFVGAAVLYWLGMIGGSIVAVFAVVPVIMIGKLFLGIKIITMVSVTVCLCLFFAILVWLMGYMFFGFCILDNPYIGSLEALRMSAALVKGYRGQIIKTLLFTFLAAMGPLFMLLVVGMTGTKLFLAGSDMSTFLINFVFILVTYPIFFLCSSYMYRALNPKQSEIDKNLSEN